MNLVDKALENLVHERDRCRHILDYAPNGEDPRDVHRRMQALEVLISQRKIKLSMLYGGHHFDNIM